MIEQVKGITIKEIKKHIDADEYYSYVDLHELAAEIVLKETHDTKSIIHDDGDGWAGQLTFKFKSKVEGVKDIVTTDFYGTCSFCDTLHAIYEDNDIENDLAYMVLHVMQSMSEQLEAIK
ncbi:hypothetical protein P3U41_06115 [Mammaliicoccus sciuri]|uniref:hypothetical protein n=1 Tax=Mammaliicoccus sciuri TaxID=1296 RepID=UPI002B25B7D0|nr:hypothetical protein [Mammaliicoccus sciuri]WQL34346.1 hypothetical protein P3U41_06115 [Mammaliicoccus sciuri]WQL61285.1 hypothetical protein P3T96_06115 [Mammaliicoccus sciuri]